MRNFCAFEILSVLKVHDEMGLENMEEWKRGFIDMNEIVSITYDTHNDEECCYILLSNGEGFVINMTANQLHSKIANSI